MGKTTIGWCDHSVNPIRARDRATGKVGHYCEKISQGCTNCYSSTLQSRFGLPAFAQQRRLEGLEVFLDPTKLAEVRRRRTPTRYFWEDMSDLFGAWVREEWLDACLATMVATPQHTHQLLTKRPERMAEYFTRHPVPDHCWLGVSVEDQPCTTRLDTLLQIPAAVHFVSCEPLLGPLDVTPWLGTLSWVIIGGESGKASNARPMQSDWALAILQQCQAAQVPVFFKQAGTHLAKAWYCRHPKGATLAAWPAAFQVQQFPGQARLVARATPPVRAAAPRGRCGCCGASVYPEYDGEVCDDCDPYPRDHNGLIRD